MLSSGIGSVAKVVGWRAFVHLTQQDARGPLEKVRFWPPSIPPSKKKNLNQALGGSVVDVRGRWGPKRPPEGRGASGILLSKMDKCPPPHYWRTSAYISIPSQISVD